MTHCDHFREDGVRKFLHLCCCLGILVDIGTEEDNGLVRKRVDHVLNQLQEMHADHVRLSGELSGAVFVKQLLRLGQKTVHFQRLLTLEPRLQHLFHNQDLVIVHRRFLIFSSKCFQSTEHFGWCVGSNNLGYFLKGTTMYCLTTIVVWVVHKPKFNS